MRDADRAQHGCDDAIAGVGGVVEARSGIVEQCMLPVRLHQNREALARRPAPSGGTRRALAAAARRRTKVSATRSPSHLPGTPRGASNHRTPSDPAIAAHAGGACCCHTAAGSVLSSSRKLATYANTSCATTSNRSHGTTIAASVKGHHDERDERNGDRIRQRGDDRYLLEETSMSGISPSGDRRLRTRGLAPQPAPCRCVRRRCRAADPPRRTTARIRA